MCTRTFKSLDRSAPGPGARSDSSAESATPVQPEELPTRRVIQRHSTSPKLEVSVDAGAYVVKSQEMADKLRLVAGSERKVSLRLLRREFDCRHRLVASQRTLHCRAAFSPL